MTHTKVSSVYMVDGAGIGHFGQQVIEDQQGARLNSQFCLSRTCEFKPNNFTLALKWSLIGYG